MLKLTHVYLRKRTTSKTHILNFILMKSVKRITYDFFFLDYHMLVIESLDADTELRRLSPVALSANGYTDLLNGPMDHGCCFGYSCMERLSTFYSIVAAQNNYTLYFTGKQMISALALVSDLNQIHLVQVTTVTPRDSQMDFLFALAVCPRFQ